METDIGMGMDTVIFRVCGIGQSWGVESRFSRRHTHKSPTKSGIVGLVCSAGGVARDDEDTIAAIAGGHMCSRVDSPGEVAVDYHSTEGVLTTLGDKPRTVISHRSYLMGACFSIGLTWPSSTGIAHNVHAWLTMPARTLFLGRKKFPWEMERKPELVTGLPHDDDRYRHARKKLLQWHECAYHPRSEQDSWTVVEDTTSLLNIPAVEERAGFPVDYIHSKRKLKPHRTRTIHLTHSDVDFTQV